MQVTRDELAEIPGVEQVGGNFIHGEGESRAILAETRDGVFVVTPEGEAAVSAHRAKVASEADKPKTATKAKTKDAAPTKVEQPSGDQTQSNDDILASLTGGK